MKINLMEDSFDKEEILAVNNCLESRKYTQGEVVKDFEEKFANWNDSKYAVMVNSGSSANLLMVSLLKHKHNLMDGDEIIVPCVTWSTTVYPIIQNSLIPVFCDVDESFNIDIDSIRRMKSDKTKAIFVVHLLGQPANLSMIKNYCEKNNLLLIEDCCESTGAKKEDLKIGNHGLMGSFSFYFGHHMTTIEGGMIVTNDYETCDLLKSMRSHGWVRGSLREEKYKDHAYKDYLFDMLGYNVRSTNLNAAIGLVQLNKLDGFIKKRLENHNYFLEKISGMGFQYQKVDLKETTSFCFGIILQNQKQRNLLLKNLKTEGVECRPIVGGNLIRQPVFNNVIHKTDKTPMADKIHECGLYLPNNQFINKDKIDYMLNSIKKILKENE